ncbi:hypothetical protein AB0301_04255, partial [Microbacterium profundi]
PSPRLGNPRRDLQRTMLKPSHTTLHLELEPGLGGSIDLAPADSGGARFTVRMPASALVAARA